MQIIHAEHVANIIYRDMCYKKATLHEHCLYQKF